jgi:toxin ParE1/3/4
MLEFHEDAIADIDAIERYIGDYNPTAAANMTAKIIGTAELLAKRPEIGRAGIVAGTREFSVVGGRYKIVFRVVSRGILVTNVIHTSRNWP